MPRKGTKTAGSLVYLIFFFVEKLDAPEGDENCKIICACKFDPKFEKLDAPEGDENTRFPDSCWNRRSTIEKLDAPEGDENARARFFLSFFFKLRN